MEDGDQCYHHHPSLLRHGCDLMYQLIVQLLPQLRDRDLLPYLLVRLQHDYVQNFDLELLHYDYAETHYFQHLHYDCAHHYPQYLFHYNSNFCVLRQLYLPLSTFLFDPLSQTHIHTFKNDIESTIF